MCECERTITCRGSDIEVGEEREGDCAFRLRNVWVANGKSWGDVIKDKRFKLGHFAQSGQPIFERRIRMRIGQQLEGLQALEEWRLPSDTAAEQLKARELGCSSIEKGIRDDTL